MKAHLIDEKYTWHQFRDALVDIFVHHLNETLATSPILCTTIVVFHHQAFKTLKKRILLSRIGIKCASSCLVLGYGEVGATPCLFPDAVCQ